ncbi:hypothetical protein TcYC6_0034110 [Trypanosoma cruzi]|nr:hypothetical protein TcYC6_0034110 [Trypanosoma cruzi]
MTTCRIIQVAAVRPEREIHDNESMYPRCGDGPVREIYDDESRYPRCGCGPVQDMTTNRGIHAAAAHPKHVAFVFQGTTQMCSIVRRSNLTPYVKMGRATTFF